MARHALAICTCLVALLAGGQGLTYSQKISSEAKSQFKVKYRGKSFRLRVDLRRFEPYVGNQYVDSLGLHYPNYKQPITFEKIESVAIEDVGNTGGNFWLSVARQPGTASRAVAAEVTTGLFGAPHSGESAIDAATRESMAAIELRIGGNPKLLTSEQQLEAIEKLLRLVFYIDDQPSEAELRDYVRLHPDYPPEALRDVTGLPVEVIKAVLTEEPRAPGQ